MAALIKKNLRLWGYGKAVALFAGCLIFSISGRLNDGIYLEQHLLSAVSDHYYLTYCMLPIVLLSCFSFLDDDEEEAPSVKPCSVDILGISLGEEGLLIIPREVRMQCEPLVNAANALMNALNDLPVSTVDKNAIAMLAADLMAQAEQEGVKNGVEAYTDFTHDMTPEKFAELVKSVKDDSMPS